MYAVEQLKKGGAWFAAGIAAVKREPVYFPAVTGVYVMTIGLFGLLPWVGLVLAGLFWPFGTLLIAKGARDSLAGRRPTLEILFRAWKTPETKLRMIRAGLLYAMMIVLVSVVWQLLAADDISKWEITEAGRINWDSAAEHIPYSAGILSILVYIPCAMALWFAPLLVYLKNLPLGKALFFSFFGCLANLPAIVLCLALAFGLTILVMGFSALLVAQAGLESVSMFILLPVSFLCTAVIYGTYYPMWKTVFSEVTLEASSADRVREL